MVVDVAVDVWSRVPVIVVLFSWSVVVFLEGLVLVVLDAAAFEGKYNRPKSMPSELVAFVDDAGG